MTTRQPDITNFAQLWWLFVCLMAVAFFIAEDQNYLSAMLEADRSYISLVIIAAFLAATIHAALHIFIISKRIESVTTALQASDLAAAQTMPARNRTGFEHPVNFVARFITSIEQHKGAASTEMTAQESALVLDIYADRLRNPSETGWYLVDILIRLGLVGTIIGFIIVLSALSDGPAPTGDNIQTLLIAMSAGMGTALYTTLAGLICASLLGAQHMILSRAIEHLIGLLIDLKSRILTCERHQ